MAINHCFQRLSKNAQETGKKIASRLSALKNKLFLASADGQLYYRHSLAVRIMHWGNAFFLAILLMSGLGIFNVHPALYWGKSSYTGAPAVLEIGGRENSNGEIAGITRIGSHEFNTTGILGASRNPDGELTIRGFPYWITIPDGQWLAMARRWHFFFAWLLFANGIVFMAYSVISGHLSRDLLPTPQDWRSIGRSIVDHLLLRNAGEGARQYNILQKLAYLGVIFFLLPLMVLMGLGMSPALDTLYPGWVDFFAGRQSVRTIHFIIAWLLVLFVSVHVTEVIISGFWNNVRSMITGYYRIKKETEK